MLAAAANSTNSKPRYLVVELGFNIVACAANLALPLLGISYWFISVPLFLRKRASTTLLHQKR